MAVLVDKGLAGGGGGGGISNDRTFVCLLFCTLYPPKFRSFSKWKKVALRVSFETSFDSKQPKLEPKLVSALSETQRLFRLFRFYTETESFDVSIEPKQTKDKQKQFDREHILQFCTENLWFFRIFWFFSRFFSVFFSVFSFFFSVFSVCIETICFGVSVVSLL